MEVTELKAVCGVLEALSKPEADNTTRFEALRLYESYKCNKRCAEIGFYLLNTLSLPPNVRHYGLLLIKHRVRSHWSIMTNKERSSVKSQLLATISSCSIDEHFYIKTTLASILNELVKHVWPQDWPSMLDEVTSHYCGEETLGTTEIMVSMLQTLAEDVVLFDSIENKSRGRDLRKTLLLFSPDIVKFLLKVLRAQAALANVDRSVGHVRFVERAVTAVEAYAGWMKPQFLFLDKGVLETLFFLCESEMCQVAAAECLLIIVSRKGGAYERKMLLQLTDDLFVERLASAVRLASGLERFNQERLVLLRTLGNVVSALNSLLISIWDDKSFQESTNELKSRKRFLELLFYLTTHESKCVSYTVSHCWTRLLQHKHIRNDYTLRQTLPLLVDFAAQSICKDLVKKNVYSRFEERDINDDEELGLLLKNFRGNMVELLRYCTLTLPIESLKKCYQYTEIQLYSKYDSEDEKNVRYEGVLSFLETVLGSVVLAAENHSQTHLLPIEHSEVILKAFISHETDHPVTLYTCLSCATALCKVIVFSSNPTYYFKLLIDHIFVLLDLTTDSTDSNKQFQPSFRKLRTHLRVTLVHLAKSFSNILVHLAEYFNILVQERLNEVPCKLSSIERVALFDALLSICMEWDDVSRQSLLISDIMKTTLPIIQSPEFLNCLNSAKDFANAIGMGIVPLNEASARLLPSTKLRYDISYYISITLIVVHRSQTRKNGKEAHSSVVNPCIAHLNGAFGHVANLIRALTAMWAPEAKEFIHPENLRALGLKDDMKIELLSHLKVSSMTEKHKTGEKPYIYWENLQTFLVRKLDCCYQILGLIAAVSGPPFYHTERLEQVVALKVLSNIEFLSPLRLKALARQFITPFFKFCPEELVTNVCSPLLQRYCQCVMDKLQPAWKAYDQNAPSRLQSGAVGNDDEKEEQEVVEEQLLLSLTREYFDLLISLCIVKRSFKNSQNCVSGDTMDSTSMKSFDNHRHVADLSPLGIAIADSPSCENVLVSALICLAWHDQTSCCKATQLLFPLLHRLTQYRCALFNGEIARFVLKAIMYGLKRHGDNSVYEARLTSLAVKMIVALKPQQEQTIASIIQSILQKINMEEVKLFLTEFDTSNYKQKRLSFKKLVNEGIDLRVVQHFEVISKTEVFAPLFPRRRHRMQTEETCVGNT